MLFTALLVALASGTNYVRPLHLDNATPSRMKSCSRYSRVRLSAMSYPRSCSPEVHSIWTTAFCTAASFAHSNEHCRIVRKWFVRSIHLVFRYQHVCAVGVYGTAPLWGRIVDSKGPKVLLIIGFVSLLVGYNGIRYLYDTGLPDGATDLSTIVFLTLILFGFLTGIGGNGGLTSAMNATAKSFPDELVSFHRSCARPGI